MSVQLHDQGIFIVQTMDGRTSCSVRSWNDFAHSAPVEVLEMQLDRLLR